MKAPLILLATAILFSCNSNTENKDTQQMNIPEPKAEKKPEILSVHDDDRIDNYFWMRLSDEQKEAETPDEQTKQVVDYLNAENDYKEKVMAHTEDLQSSLYEEMIGRIDQSDESVPVKVNGYWYYSRFEEGEDYPYHCRKKESLEADEEIMLDGPAMGKDKSYFAIGGKSVSEDNKVLVYGEDLVSRRQYTLHFKDLETGEMLDDKIENTTGGATWAADNKTVFYTVKDPVTLRSYRIYKHRLGTEQAQDELVYEEKDDTFGTAVYKTKSREYLVIASFQTLSTEYRFLKADNPDGEWRIFEPRQRDHEYSIAHYGDHFYVVTNWEAKNFRLMKTPVTNTGRANWSEVIAHRPEVLLEGVEIFKDYLVLEERSDALNHIRVKPWDGSEEHYLEFPDPAYSAWVGANPEFDTKVMRFGYTSMTTPSSVYDYDLSTKDRTLKKQQKVLGGQFDSNNYESERVFVEAQDGRKVPMSIVYRKGFEKNGNQPILLYAYGSYGHTIDPSFSSVRLSLLDRGFAFAIAHIRGGQAMGREWYEDGKLLKKKNTFTDFIDCGDWLTENKYTSQEHLYAMGGSAGGLLMGAIVNMRPEMWNGVVAAVPFVDVVSTMLDESIPLTTGEFDEWGNPKDKAYYDYIKSYSPYDNIEATCYPNLLITTGYWDSQVQYWEPAKWIAKLRDLRTCDNRLIMDCNMETGHGGASGRFQRYKEIALEYAFMLDLEGISE